MSRRGLARFVAQDGAQPVAGADPSVLPAPLARFLQPRAPVAPGEACELCAEPLPGWHRHVVDLERRGMLCACQGCSLLFTDVTDTDARYRTVPDRYLGVAPFTMAPQTWAALQIPVGMAFVVGNTRLERTVAFYPSPGGATESELPMAAWADIVAANPGLDRVEPDVEAVLIRTDGPQPSCFVVPVDRCYELVGVMRLHWRGFDGGQEVREQLATFFADVEQRSRPLRGARS